jgi:hypothetical protein
LTKLGAVGRLFGAGGWRRTFSLAVSMSDMTDLRFDTTLRPNQKWLSDLFGGEPATLAGVKVAYPRVGLRVTFRPGLQRDVEMAACTQLGLLIRFVAECGSLGARPQHGFGLVRTVTLPSGIELLSGHEAVGELVGLLQACRQPDAKRDRASPFDLRNFVKLEYELPASDLQRYVPAGAGKQGGSDYLPCAFDIRYDAVGRAGGDGRGWGMRRWLRIAKGWTESEDANKGYGPIDLLFGPRSNWGQGPRSGSLDDANRRSGTLFFGMPYLIDGGSYRLRIFGFAHPEVDTPAGKLSPRTLATLCDEYVGYATEGRVRPVSPVFGVEVLGQEGSP